MHDLPAYGVFANGGYQVNLWLIQRVTDARGQLLFEAHKQAQPPEDSRVVDSRNAFVMDSMLRKVTRSGTGAMATQKLGRRM